jgi:hypothetical protein
MKIGIEFLQPGIYRLFYEVLRENPHPNNIDPAIIEHITRTILHLDLDAFFCAVEGSTTRRRRSLAPQQPQLRPAI